jgi:hypothetical protein
MVIKIVTRETTAGRPIAMSFALEESIQRPDKSVVVTAIRRYSFRLATLNSLGVQSDANRARFTELALTCAQKVFEVDDLKRDPIAGLVERQKDTFAYSWHVFDRI